MHHVFYCVPPCFAPIWDSSWSSKGKAEDRIDGLLDEMFLECDGERETFAWVEAGQGIEPQAQKRPQRFKRWKLREHYGGEGRALELPVIEEYVGIPDGFLPGHATREEAIRYAIDQWNLQMSCAYPGRLAPLGEPFIIPPMPAECGPSGFQ